MKRVCFIGSFDKIDLIMYASKVLVEMNKKVLIIDATVNQKAKYIVPAINPTVSYVTEFEGFDVAVGFNNYNEIKQYLGIPEAAALVYDYIFLDMDNPNLLDGFNIYDIEQKYFVTSADLYSLKKGLELISGIRLPIDMTKIYFSNHMSQQEDDYLNFLSLGYKVRWNDDIIYIPNTDSDRDIITENQRLAKINVKGISLEYKDALAYLVHDIADQERESEIKRTIKLLERGA